MKLLLLATIVISLHLASYAVAEEHDPEHDSKSEALAQEAHEVVSSYCAEAAGADMTTAAESVAVVSNVWARVSAQVEISRKIYLLYWRGVLAQCLDQEDRALEDLMAFVEARKGSDLWAGLLADAGRRIGRLERQASGPRTIHPGWILGSVLAAASAGSGIGAGVAWQQSQQTATAEIYPDGAPGSALEASIAKGESEATASAILTGVAVGCGIGSMVSFLTAAIGQDQRITAQVKPTVPVPVPTRTGVAVTWGARW